MSFLGLETNFPPMYELYYTRTYRFWPWSYMYSYDKSVNFMKKLHFMKDFRQYAHCNIFWNCIIIGTLALCLISHLKIFTIISIILKKIKIYCRGAGNGGAGGAIAPPIFLQIGKIPAFSTPNISRSKEGAPLKKSSAPPIFCTFRCPWVLNSIHRFF